ncbi:MAG: response regulator transcription factor [Bacteroidales bacterium]|nr:response regulator transcription factor [Bacteroidales bacterium]
MLTDREKALIQEFCKGRSCSQIAKELILSEHTVQTHRKNIQRKLNVHSIYSIVSFAYKNNLA